jgi:tetratricopeptide (TPR) repeat protein
MSVKIGYGIFLLFSLAVLQYWIPLNEVAFAVAILWFIYAIAIFRIIWRNGFFVTIELILSFLYVTIIVLDQREFHNFYRSNYYEDFIISKYTEPQGIVADLYINKYKDTDTVQARHFMNEAMLAQKNRDYEKALELYNKSIDLNPDDAHAYHKRGYFKLSTLDLNEDVALSAMKDFSRAIRLDSTLTIIYFHRSIASAYIGLKGRSLLDYMKVWQRDSILPEEEFRNKYSMSKKSFSKPFHP